MGMYVNPGNEGFRRIRLGDYVDKSGFITLVNRVVGTVSGLVCSTRPRSFGKTFAAEALVSYYPCGADSRSLFEGLDVSGDPSFENHLNAYNVVHLDLTTFREAEDVASEVTRVILADLREEHPSVGMGNAGQPNELTSALADFAGATGVDLCS